MGIGFYIIMDIERQANSYEHPSSVSFQANLLSYQKMTLSLSFSSFCLITAAVPRRAPTPSGAVMWQEARKHERKLRGMMVDYKRRGERRREYYEKIVRFFI